MPKSMNNSNEVHSHLRVHVALISNTKNYNQQLIIEQHK